MEDSDVDRTLELLWRHKLGTPQGTRGPKQRVSVDEVIRAGIAVADEEGLPAFAMRKVADRLGLKLMSIYTYVPGRSELIGLMVDEVIGETPHPSHAGSLRQRLAGVARHMWDEYHRHPWLLQIDDSRPWIGPHGCDRYEWQLAAIEGAGFDDLEMDQIITLISCYTAGAARTSIASRSTTERSGITDAEWWAVNAPIRSFRFGLDRLLDGVELMLRDRVTPPAAT
jgi:AcrR family transcriptional regulator